ncbi:S-adenosyl-L-methionine-dependent methyltransferase [Leucogyrophana mollusca]|uniref:S-adenosyl-L-methionine-dependent methyltransferase n=1 Tax=Leucogyrophana mollusca TaxID=85980 RepID=A0ACB8BXL9_9AGAM|nr:S-adenosyl-L-methionine-dependent methyltransferase [Leucogyrophana mollusca]
MVDTTRLWNKDDLKRMGEILREDPTRGWDNTWYTHILTISAIEDLILRYRQQNVMPWDAGEVQRPLQDLVLSGTLDLPRLGRALVPGCGRGYDASFIASALGLDVLAMDISPTAIQAAKEHLARAPQALSGGTIVFEETDFFTYSVSDDEKFALAYDYTFFVAIPPSRRPEWGQQMSALIKPGGYLITLVFPLGLPLEGGPPFHVEPDDYVEPLGDGWEKVLDKIPEVSSEHHEGKDRLVVWLRV